MSKKLKECSLTFPWIQWENISGYHKMQILRDNGIPIISLNPLQCSEGKISLESDIWSDNVVVRWKEIKDKKWNHE